MCVCACVYACVSMYGCTCVLRGCVSALRACVQQFRFRIIEQLCTSVFSTNGALRWVEDTITQLGA